GKKRETAWADGGTNFASYFGITRWGFIGEYCLQECEEVDKIFTVKFFIKNDRGQTFWSGLNNNEFPYNTGYWCDKLSVIPLVSGDYKLVLHNNQYQYDYGTISLQVNGDKVKIKAVSTFPHADFVMYRMHAFIGTMDELDALKEDTGCPDYLNFPLILEKEGNIIEAEYMLN
ncbi:MAG: hypothetical protein MI922_22815, partial [Bacteroidales bacterium]|nr:hypothetical protein [Bacteroidales bacterium]